MTSRAPSRWLSGGDEHVGGAAPVAKEETRPCPSPLAVTMVVEHDVGVSSVEALDVAAKLLVSSRLLVQALKTRSHAIILGAWSGAGWPWIAEDSANFQRTL